MVTKSFGLSETERLIVAELNHLELNQGGRRPAVACYGGDQQDEIDVHEPEHRAQRASTSVATLGGAGVSTRKSSKSSTSDVSNRKTTSRWIPKKMRKSACSWRRRTRPRDERRCDQQSEDERGLTLPGCAAGEADIRSRKLREIHPDPGV